MLFLSASSGESNLTWIAIGDFNATIGVKLDRLSALMLVVTGVGALIHWYSQVTLKETDPTPATLPV